MKLFLFSLLAVVVGAEWAYGQQDFDVPTPLSSHELHKWQRHIRGFRRDHNFALSTGVTSGTWEVSHLGTLEDESFASSGVFNKFQYSFHLPIYEGFGYFLGSSVGYFYESADSRSAFKPVASMMFPGVMAGITQNLTPVFRISTALEVYLERHEDVGERDGIDPDPEISITMQSYDLGVFFDFFYDLAWAIRLEGHGRVVDFYAPTSSSGYAVDARLHKTDAWLGVGILYHLL